MTLRTLPERNGRRGVGSSGGTMSAKDLRDAVIDSVRELDR
jgi:hypothetical protein